MSLRKLFLVAVIGVALVSLTAEQNGASPIAAGTLAPAASVGARVRARIGHLGARLMAPTVHSTLDKSERDLEELEPAIRRAQPHEIIRARKLAAKVVALDSAANHSLNTGHPIRALRQALGGKQFVTAVRQNVLEEAVFR